MSQQQLYLPLGGDFVLNSNGGLQWTDSWDAIVQNLERFLFTNPATIDIYGNPQPADWIFQPQFGLGASQMLGQTFNSAYISTLEQKIYQAALAAQTGNSTVPPAVTITQGPNPQQLNVQIVVTPTGQNQQTINVVVP